MAEVVVELLTKAHDRALFDCGHVPQNDFLKLRARKHAEVGYSKTWVAVEHGSTEILGFIALSAGNVLSADLVESNTANLPKYPMPVLHVGQLATDLRFQGKGIGSLLLQFAILKAIELSQSVGCYAVELVADNPSAHAFYVRRGFKPIPSGGRLYLPITTLARAAQRQS